MKLTMRFLKGVYILMAAILIFNSGFAQVLALPAVADLPVAEIADSQEAMLAPEADAMTAITLDALPMQDELVAQEAIAVPNDDLPVGRTPIFKDTAFPHYKKLTGKFGKFAQATYDTLIPGPATGEGEGEGELSDPAVIVSCDIGTQGNKYECGQTINCGAWIKNLSDITATDLLLELSFGMKVFISNIHVTGLDGDIINCSLQNDKVVCDGDLSPDNIVDVWFDVGLPSCQCDQTYDFTYGGVVSASNGDLDLSNNKDAYTVTIQSPEDCECKPYYKALDYNDDKKLDDADKDVLTQLILQGGTCPTGKTCDINADGKITTADVMLLTKIILGMHDYGEDCNDEIDNNCNGTKNEGCGGTTGSLSDPAIDVYCEYKPEYTCGSTVLCFADIQNTDKATADTVNLSGSIVIPANAKIIPGSLNDGKLDCKVTNVPNGGSKITCNGVELKIKEFVPTFFELQLDQCACDASYTTYVDGYVSATNGDVNFNNNESHDAFLVEGLPCGACVDPITTLTLGSHTNGQTVTNSPVLLTGKVAGGVKEVIVTDGTTNWKATITNGVWSVTIPLKTGKNVLWIIAYPKDPNCAIKTLDLTLTYQPNSGPYCGDGKTDQGEECDDGNQNNNDTCSNTCKLTICGDGIKQMPNGKGQNEECDDGNQNNNDSCTNECKNNNPNVCVDPITNFTVDSHTNGQTVYTSPVLLTGKVAGGVKEVIVTDGTTNWKATIVNGVWSVTVPLQLGKNTLWVIAYPNDPDCKTEIIDLTLYYTQLSPVCGNGVQETGEECDDGNQNNNDTCSNTCKLTVCGDGIKQMPNGKGQNEECDDGNQNNNDSCTNECKNNNTNVCVDPITTFTVDSHTNGQTVYTSPVLLTGKVAGGVKEVIVTDGTTNWKATIVNGVWSVTIPLNVGTNNLWIIAYPNDPDCAIKTLDLTLIYVKLSPVCGNGIQEGGEECDDGNQNNNDTCSNTCKLTICGDAIKQTPNGKGQNEECDDGNQNNNDSCTNECKNNNTNVCVDPITKLTVDSHINGQTVTNSPVLITGTVIGGVDHIVVTDGNNTYNATINGTTWSVSVPLQVGINNFWVIAYPKDSDCDIEMRDFTLIYTPGGVCVDPITHLSISSHYNNQVVYTPSVLLTGLVIGGVKNIVVSQGSATYPATINGNVWSALVNLNVGNNAFVVTAYPNDADCTISTSYINLFYTKLSEIKSDPAIDVSCTPSSASVCGGTMDCQGVLSNTNIATAHAQNVVAYLDVPAGFTVASGTLTVTTDAGSIMQCVLSGADQLVCNGMLEIGDNSTVKFGVNLAPCNCGSFTWMTLEGNISASNGDLNPNNNYDVWTSKILSSQTNCGGGSCDNVIGNLTITTPLSGTVTSGTSIVVSGTYAGGVQSITVNGTVATLSGNTYTATVALNAGTNVITVIAIPADADCKTETQLTTVIRTTGVCPAPLTLTIASPNNNATTRNAQIALSGTISDTGAVVKVAGEQVVVTASGTYQATVELVLGTNTILVTAGTGDCAVSKTVNVVRTTGGGGGSGGGGSNYCGDGRVRNSEQCDDGNNRNGDGCDSNCKLEDAVCGNGRKESGEQCDDGNTKSGDSCSSTCKTSITTAIKKKKITTIIGNRKPLPVPLDLPVVLPKTGELARVVQVTRVAQTTAGSAQ